MCLVNVSKDHSIDNMRKTGLNRYVYDFRIDYDAIVVDDILDIHNYLMKKNDIKRYLDLLKKYVYCSDMIYWTYCGKCNSIEMRFYE